MSREIKFRAWDWIQGMYTVDVLALTADSWPVWGKDLTGISIPHQPSIKVMQFTGIQDSKGVDIYEGDILRPDYHDEAPEPVSWSDECSCWCWGEDAFSDYHMEGADVIGNIYENPELAEQT
jgi:hypothetical protein